MYDEDLKAFWGTQIYMFLELIFNYCGLWLSNEYILQKVMFSLVWET